MSRMPKGFMTRHVWWRTKLGHWSLILSAVDDVGKDFADVENRLAHCMLTPTPKVLETAMAVDVETLKTPAPPRTRTAPRKPVKRVLPKK